MDNDNKNAMASNEPAYADAADLLRDLDEEEDDCEYEPADTEVPASRSLVNMLSSSTGLEAISSANFQGAATIPSLPPVMLGLPSNHAMEKVPSSGDEDAEAAKGGTEEESEILQVQEDENAELSENHDSADAHSSDVVPSGEDAIVPEIPPAPKKPAEMPAAPKSDPNNLAAPSARKPTIPAIKPFETRPSEKESAEHTDDLSEVSLEKHAVETEDDKNSEPRASMSKKPPVPPKKPAPSMKMNGRVLRENEIAYTSEAINDMLPGGKNDDGRDLAYKFTDNNWYAQVFNEDYLRTIPKSSPRQTSREAKFIIDRLGIQSGARVLDLCCGFGRHTIELAARGFDMVGLDLSMVMLKKALADAQARGQAIKFVHGDMRKLTFKSIFDAIYNVQTSFGYFDDLSNFKVLQDMYRALKPGGVLLLETVNRDFLVNELPLRLWWKGTECTLLEEIDMEPLSGLLKVQRSFVFDDTSRAPWEQKIQIRLYSVPEMRSLLTRAGFTVIELSGDYSLPGAYFGAASPKNIFLAEREAK